MSGAPQDHPCLIFVNGCRHPAIEAQHTGFGPDERSGERAMSRSDGHIKTPDLLLIGTRIMVRDPAGSYFAVVQTAKYHVGKLAEPGYWAHDFCSESPAG